MSVLDSIRTPVDRPVLVTICGDSGMGKTSLAATFPKPIFIRAEDGMQAIPEANRPDAFPLLSKTADLWAQLTALCNEPHEYQTLVVDSVTALERMFLAEVLASDLKAKSINQAMGGYGAGRAAVASMHQRVRKAAGILNDRRGMHVVFIGHVEVESVPSPSVDDYMRFNLRMHKNSVAPYVDDVDVVGFLCLEMFVRGDDDARKKAISTNTRQMICHATASNVSKNRYGITEPIDVVPNQNPFAEFVPSLMRAGGSDAPVFTRAAPAVDKSDDSQPHEEELENEA